MATKVQASRVMELRVDKVTYLRGVGWRCVTSTRGLLKGVGIETRFTHSYGELYPILTGKAKKMCRYVYSNAQSPACLTNLGTGRSESIFRCVLMRRGSPIGVTD